MSIREFHKPPAASDMSIREFRKPPAASNMGIREFILLSGKPNNYQKEFPNLQSVTKQFNIFRAVDPKFGNTSSLKHSFFSNRYPNLNLSAYKSTRILVRNIVSFPIQMFFFKRQYGYYYNFTTDLVLH